MENVRKELCREYDRKEKESEVAQSCQTLCDPMDCSLPGSSVPVSKQEYWSGLSFPSPGDLPNPGIEPGSPVLQADALPSEPPGKSSSRGPSIHSSIPKAQNSLVALIRFS